MSIKRENALRPFSRDHFTGLLHAQRLMHASNEHPRFKPERVLKDFKRDWKNEISLHFADEERLLIPLPVSEGSKGRLTEEHELLRSLIGELGGKTRLDHQLMKKVGQLLDRHIRWEEHEFFPEIEKALSQQELASLEVETDRVEQSRARNSGSCQVRE